MKAKGKSKKLIIYENKNTGTLFLRATKADNYGDFRIISENAIICEHYVTLTKSVRNEILGEWVRKILLRCK